MSLTELSTRVSLVRERGFRFIEDHDCDNETIHLCILLRLIDLMEDEEDYVECSGEFEWVLESIWFAS